MGVFEMIIGGGLLCCNSILVAYLISSNRRTSSGNCEPPRAESKSSKPTEDSHSIAAPSNFDVTTFLNQLSDKVIAELPRLLTVTIGDVMTSDVEFTPEDSDGQENEISENHLQQKSSQLDKDQMRAAFETDIRDVEELDPSAPEASGVSFDELDEAVSVAVDANASEDAKLKAGEVLRKYKGTHFYDAITSNERIGKQVDICVGMVIKASIKSTPNSDKNVGDNKIKKVGKKKEKPFNVDDFLAEYPS